MGKGSNVAKANAARARNAKEQGKSKEEREASKAKAEKDRNAKKCLVCLQTFMISSKDKLLYDHVVAKHDKLIKEPEKCFPHLKGFDPNAPEPTGIAVAQAAAKKKVKKVATPASSTRPPRATGATHRVISPRRRRRRTSRTCWPRACKSVRKRSSLPSPTLAVQRGTQPLRRAPCTKGR